MSAGWNVPDRGFQTGQGFRHGRVMLAVKGEQFVENVMALLQGRMVEHLSAGHHVVGDATETLGDFDMGMSVMDDLLSLRACDPLIQAERRCQARYLDRSRWDYSLAAGRWCPVAHCG